MVLTLKNNCFGTDTYFESCLLQPIISLYKPQYTCESTFIKIGKYDDAELTKAAMEFSFDSFAEDWNSPEDDVWDNI